MVKPYPRTRGDVDDECVAAVLECLNLEPGDEQMVRAHIATLGVMLTHKSREEKRTADRRKLLRLLRKLDYDKWADEVEDFEKLIRMAPPRSDRTKYQCAFCAYALMSFVNLDEKVTDYRVGKFQETSALIYSAITGKEAIGDDMERVCALVIRDVVKPGIWPKLRDG